MLSHTTAETSALTLYWVLQAAAEKAAKAAKRLYVGNIPFETTQAELTAFFDTMMADTGAVAADTEEQGSAVTSCTLYDRSSAAAGPKAKYAFLNLRSVEETSNCVAFDGVFLKTNSLKVCCRSDGPPCLFVHCVDTFSERLKNCVVTVVAGFRFRLWLYTWDYLVCS